MSRTLARRRRRIADLPVVVAQVAADLLIVTIALGMVRAALAFL